MLKSKLSKKNRPTSVVVGPHTETTDYLGVRELFGIRRGLAYHLWENGDIESFSLKEGNEKRGKRLFVVQSIRNFLNSKRANRQPAAAEKGDDSLGLQNSLGTL